MGSTILVREHGFEGAESTVRRYVRLVKSEHGIEANKAYIPGDPEAGLEAEVDWGDFTAVIAGKTRRLKLFCIRSKYSGKCFVRAYPVERQQALFDAHIRAFAFFCGVFCRLIYDNMTSAVQKVFQGKKRVEQDSFARVRARLSVDTVTIYYSGRKIAEHTRTYGNNKWILDPGSGPLPGFAPPPTGGFCHRPADPAMAQPVVRKS